MRQILWLTLLGLVVLPVQSRGYEEMTIKNGGLIRGVVKVEGKIPKLPPPRILKFKDFCTKVPNESLVVGPGRGVRYAVVTLEGVAKGKPVEKEALHELDNSKCRFVPHVQAASVGQWLVIKNSDPILHTAHAYFHEGQPHFNVGLFPGKVTRKPLVTQDVVKILCEVHPWMTAYIVITDHPYHAVTDAYGAYEISDVPAGSYRLKLWHERLGIQEKQVEVGADEAIIVDFALSAQGEKK